MGSFRVPGTGLQFICTSHVATHEFRQMPLVCILILRENCDPAKGVDGEAERRYTGSRSP
jgi:hypothetical protein